jgi:hypothetical protein
VPVSLVLPFLFALGKEKAMESNPMTEEVTPDKTIDIKPIPISRPQVRIRKTSHRENPLKQGSVFTIHGAGFMVYEVKSRGRMLIRYMGKVEMPPIERVEMTAEEEMAPADPSPDIPSETEYQDNG